MKFRMAEKSLFAVLLRSPWWISLVLAVVVALVARLALPADMAVFGAMGGFPFLVIAVMALRRQWNTPGPARVQQLLEVVGAMTWRDFSAALEAGWTREGYAVSRREGRNSTGADFALVKAGQTTLVSGKRWKAASLGVEPLRELAAAIEQAEARGGIVVALGEVTPQASAFAKAQGIQVLQAPELAKLLQHTAMGSAARG